MAALPDDGENLLRNRASKQALFELTSNFQGSRQEQVTNESQRLSLSILRIQPTALAHCRSRCSSTCLHPNFSKICPRCFFTVRGFIPRISLISRFVLPRDDHSNTSASRCASPKRSARSAVSRPSSCSSKTTIQVPRFAPPAMRATSLSPQLSSHSGVK